MIEPKSFPAFLRLEILNLLRYFFAGFWKSTAVLWALLTLLLCYILFFRRSGSAPPAGPIDAVFAAGLALFYAGCTGLLIGVFVAAWRLFGAWVVLPLIVTPLLTSLTFYFGSGWLAAEGRDVIAALVTAAGDHKSYIDGLRLGHAGGGAAAIVLLPIILPLLLADALAILFSPIVLWQFVQLLLVAALLLFTGLLLALLLCGPFLLLSLIRRARSRYKEFLASAPPA
jgi:hypothetical protein